MRRSSKSRIAVATERRYLAQLQPATLCAALAERGHAPALLDPERAERHDLDGIALLVARGRSPALLRLVACAEAAQIATVNRSSAIEAVLDKAAMARRLATARVPSPRTRVGSVADLARTSRRADFPLVVKPVFGDNARGVKVVESRDALAELPWREPVALAQPLVPSDGRDLKLYVAGEAVWAVRKPSPLAVGVAAEPEPVPVSPALEALALRCGRLFGLELFGVDCIETPRGPVVIEVNDFPNYTGIPDAPERLARHLIARADARRLPRTA
jgi:ribosomal protein S6--L-glutamate ligase